MTVSSHSKKSKLIDEKIGLFCQHSAEILENIHARCNNTANPMTSRKAKTEKKKKTE